VVVAGRQNGAVTTCVVLVRGINVGGHNRLPMADLRAALDSSGARDIRTYLQSGNAVVTAPTSGLAARLESELLLARGLEARVIVRTAAELRAVVASNPFTDREETPKQLHVAFFDGQPDASLVEEVGTHHGSDELALGDRAIYLSYAGGSHDSPLNAALRRIGGVYTARNWGTVTRLLAMTDKAS